MEDESRVDEIVAVLKKHESYLSDGFGYYLPCKDWLTEYDGMSSDDIQMAELKKIASEIEGVIK